MESEKEDNDMPKDHPLNINQKYDGFLLDSLFKINYQKKLFLDTILIEENPNNINNDQKLCITKRYSSSNLQYNNTSVNIQYKNDIKKSMSIPNSKIDDTNIIKSQYQNFFLGNNMNFQRQNIKKQALNSQVQFFPYCYVNIDNMKKCKDYLFQITGAHLTQNEIILLRKTIFRKVLPPIKRDEIRNKLLNLKCLDKHSGKILPLLRMPSVQVTIRNYVFERRRDFEKNEMIYNFHQILQNNES